MWQDQLDAMLELVELRFVAERERITLLETQGWGPEAAPIVRSLDRKCAALESLASSLNMVRKLYGC